MKMFFFSSTPVKEILNVPMTSLVINIVYIDFIPIRLFHTLTASNNFGPVKKKNKKKNKNKGMHDKR